MTKTNTNTARAKLTAARRKMADFIAAQCDAKLDAEALIVGDNIVVSGAVSECAVVAAYFATVLKIDGVMMDDVIADDPDFADWTCVRIPEPALHAALAKAAGK